MRLSPAPGLAAWTATLLILAPLASALPVPLSGIVDGTDATALARVLTGNYSHIVVGGGNCQSAPTACPICSASLTLAPPHPAGLALAARLSEDRSTSVLVLEAGRDEPDNPGINIPAQAGSTFQSDIDWVSPLRLSLRELPRLTCLGLQDFFTTPQENANNRSVYTPRGKVLGGSSAINFLAYTRGFAQDYSAWASLAGTGGSGWSFANLLPFFKKVRLSSTPPAY